MTSLAQLTNEPAGLKVPHPPGNAAGLPLPDPHGGGGPRSLYVHVPFCLHKCHYCDFYSLVDARDRQPAFTRRLLDELDAAGPRLQRPLETIFVGGGTPTLLSPDLWAGLLPGLAASPGTEFTVEANPETLTAPLLDVLAGGGVNRLSIGAQTFDPRHLATLQRLHDPAGVGRGVHLARQAGIDNINLDLIFAIPGQSLDQWRADLERAIELEPSHVSCYGLTYEPGTPLAARLRAGAVRRVEEGLEADMYELAAARLARAGFVHYEISNWARPGLACRHNLVYWNNGWWWPLGPAAAGHVAGVRWKNVPRLGDYLAGAGLPPITGVEQLDEDGRIGEILMLGLRLVEGIDLDRAGELLSAGRRGPVRSAAVERFAAGGLLERRAGRLRLTRRGLLVADTVLAELL